MIVLNGITWDHDRGLLPLLETTKSFQKLHPDIEIHWKKRTLQEFGDFPVEELAKKYDLLLIDHPFSGEAYEQNILIDFNQYMSAEQMKIREEQEIGSTHRCYNYKGRQLALSVDASAMASVYRKDLLEKENLALPDSFDGIIELAEKTGQVAAPLCSTDIWCIFLSLGAAKCGQSFITWDGLAWEAAKWSIERIRDLYKAVVPESILYSPVQIMDRMSQENTIVYAPFCFSYVNYAWRNRKYPLRFTTVPLWKEAKTECILGGVGIAVSANSRNIEAAVSYAEYVTRPDVQENEYFLSGGQPGQKNAWLSRRNNELTNNFFQSTFRTVADAYVRPRFPGWNLFQEKSCTIINEDIRLGVGAEETVQKIQNIFHEYVHKEKGGGNNVSVSHSGEREGNRLYHVSAPPAAQCDEPEVYG